MLASEDHLAAKCLRFMSTGSAIGSIPPAELRGRRRTVLPRDRPPWRVTTASANPRNCPALC
jgi:hypothetical protein